MCKLRYLAPLIAALYFLPASAIDKDDLAKYHAKIVGMSIDENIEHPDIPKKHIEETKRRMASMQASLNTNSFKTERKERDGMVVMVTIPTASLFENNDTIVAAKGVNILHTLSRYMKVPDKYKVLVTVHSDDTGTKNYLYGMTQQRAEAIVDFLEDQGVAEGGILPYGVGNDERLSKDSTRKERAKDRRVEIYFVPGPILIENVKAGRP